MTINKSLKSLVFIFGEGNLNSRFVTALNEQKPVLEVRLTVYEWNNQTTNIKKTIPRSDRYQKRADRLQ